MIAWIIVLRGEGIHAFPRCACSRRQRFQTHFRWEDSYSSGHSASGNPALAIGRGRCGTRRAVSLRRHRFPAHALVPFPFRVQVSAVVHQPPSQLIVAAPGIRSCMTRRTRKLSPAASCALWGVRDMLVWHKAVLSWQPLPARPASGWHAPRSVYRERVNAPVRE